MVKVFKPLVPFSGNAKEIQKTSETKYFPTWIEWAAQQGKQIIKDKSTTSANVEIFVVPVNHTLYITSSWLAESNINTLSSGISRMFIESSGEIFIAMAAALADPVTFQQSYFSLSSSFPFPIKVLQGDKIILEPNGTSGALCKGGIVGFIIANNISLF